MIVRILDDAQYEIDDDASKRLDELDVELDAALTSGDQGRFDRALAVIESEVKTIGRRLDVSDIVPSDLVLPHRGATIEEVTQLLSSEKVEGN